MHDHTDAISRPPTTIMLCGIPAAFNSSSVQTNDNEIAARAINRGPPAAHHQAEYDGGRAIEIITALPRLLVARSMKLAGWVDRRIHVDCRVGPVSVR